MSTSLHWFGIECCSTETESLLEIEWAPKLGALLLKTMREKGPAKEWAARREKIRARLRTMAPEERIALLPTALCGQLGDGQHIAHLLGYGTYETTERLETLRRASIAANQEFQAKLELASDPDDAPAQEAKERARLAYAAAFAEVKAEEARLGELDLARAAEGLRKASREEWREALRTHAKAGATTWEAWLLRVLMHEIDPETAPETDAARMSLQVKVTYQDIQMPSAKHPTAVRDLALRLLTFYDEAGPLAVAMRGPPMERVPVNLPFLFEARLAGGTPKEGTVHVLLARELVGTFGKGQGGDSTAW